MPFEACEQMDAGAVGYTDSPLGTEFLNGRAMQSSDEYMRVWLDNSSIAEDTG